VQSSFRSMCRVSEYTRFGSPPIEGTSDDVTHSPDHIPAQTAPFAGRGLGKLLSSIIEPILHFDLNQFELRWIAAAAQARDPV